MKRRTYVCAPHCLVLEKKGKERTQAQINLLAFVSCFEREGMPGALQQENRP